MSQHPSGTGTREHWGTMFTQTLFMNVGIIGTGLMGQAVAERILQKKFPLFVFNRTAGKTVALQKKGARRCLSVDELLKKADLVLLFLSDAEAVNRTLFASSRILISKTVIQMGTIAPWESQTIERCVQKAQGEYLECPVLGSRREAGAGNLILMVGSTPRQFKRWNKFFKVIGRRIHYIGPVGKAAVIKLALNNLIASHAVSFSLSLGLVRKSKIKVAIFMDLLRQSSLYAPMFDKKLPNWLKAQYSHPNFSAKHLLKDVRLIRALAKRNGLATESIDSLRKIIDKTLSLGFGEDDYSAVYNAVNRGGA